jgi:hypothetical protein
VAAEAVLVSHASALTSVLANADITCRMLPLGILAIVLAILFEVYKSDFERWVSPLANWLRVRKS